MEFQQVTLDNWLPIQDEFINLMNALLTQLDEIDKSLCAIASAIDDLRS